jgi:ribonuclease HI
MIKIYTDGSCLTNPGDGGWAAIINIDGEIKKISGNEKNTTNNRMELIAPINALKYMNSKDPIEIFTDSKYVKNGITEWINTWVLNNWKTSNKEDVKNKDLWIELYKLNQSLNVKWNWVKAHAGDTLNEEVDILAKEAAYLNRV